MHLHSFLILAVASRATLTFGADLALSCDFDGGFCGFNNTGTLDWTRNSGSTASGGTGPYGDHSSGTGSYLYTEASSPNSPYGGPFVIESALRTKGIQTVSFWYSMNGPALGELRFETTDDSGEVGDQAASWITHWAKNGDQGLQWQFATFSSDSPLARRVRFWSTTGSSYAGDIAVDDVEIAKWGSPAPTTSPQPTASPKPTSRPTPLPSPTPTTATLSTGVQLQAAVVTGATVVIDGPMYLESVVLIDEISSLTVVGAGDSGGTMGKISGNKTVCIMFFSGTSTTAELGNLTLTDGYSDYAGGGALVVQAGARVSLKNVVISNCYTTRKGGAIVLFGAFLRMQECNILNNVAASDGGGMLVTSGATLLAIKCNFVLNQALYGGGVAIAPGVSLQFHSCLFSQNEAISGGGIYAEFSNASFTDCIVTENKAEAGGGFYLSGGDSTFFTLERCETSLNAGTNVGGGGMYVSGPHVNVIESSLVNNSATGPTFSVPQGDCTASGGCFFSPGFPSLYPPDNQCTIVADANGTLEVDSFSLNNVFSSMIVGGVSYTAHTGPDGVQVEAGEKIIWASTPTLFVAAGFQICYRVRVSGGGLHVSSGNVRIDHGSLVSNNWATSLGGGAFVSGGSVQIMASSMMNNRAGLGGGSFYFSGGLMSAQGISMNGDIEGPSAKSAVCSSTCSAGEYGVCTQVDGGEQCFVGCTCAPCPAGKSSSLANSVSQDSCKACGAGQYSAAGSSSCMSCAPGRYASDDAQDQGGGQIRQVIDGATTCNLCPPETFSSTPSALVCQLCPEGYTSLSGSTLCDLATPGFYIDSQNKINHCPKNSECFGGVEFPRPIPGYWVELHQPFHAGDVHRCKRGTCRGGVSVANTSCFDRSANTTHCSGSIMCGSGASSPLCGSCVQGYAYSAFDRDCVSCDEAADGSLALAAWVVLSMSVFGTAVLIFVRLRLFPAAVERAIASIRRVDRIAMSGSLRVIYAMFQIIGSISLSADVVFPAPFHDMAGIFGGISLSLLPLPCVIGSNYLLEVFFWSTILPVLVAVNYATYFLRRARHWGDPTFRREGSRLHARITLVMFFVLVPVVLEKELSALVCIPVNGRKYVRDDTSIPCDSQRFRTFAATNIVFIACYFSTPIVFTVLLWRSRELINPTKTGRQNATDQGDLMAVDRLRFLFAVYTPANYLYEPFEIVRRIFLIGFIPLAAESPAKRAGIGVFVSLGCVLIRRESWPFVRQSTSLLAYVADCTVLLTFLSALAINTNLDSGIDPLWFGATLCLINTLILGLACFFGAVHIKKEYERSEWRQVLSSREHDILKRVMKVQPVDFEADSAFSSGIDAESSPGSTAESVLKKYLIASKDVKFEEMLGSGAYGRVFRGSFHGQAVAIKTMIDVTLESAQSFRAEIILTASLRSPYIVNFVGACWEQACACMVLELAPGGTLDSYLSIDRGETEALRWTEPLLGLAADVARGMTYLHGREYFDEVSGTAKSCIVHRDLKVNFQIIISCILPRPSYGAACCNHDCFAAG